jgi:hypothetical protein
MNNNNNMVDDAVMTSKLRRKFVRHWNSEPCITLYEQVYLFLSINSYLRIVTFDHGHKTHAGRQTRIENFAVPYFALADVRVEGESDSTTHGGTPTLEVGKPLAGTLLSNFA